MIQNDSEALSPQNYTSECFGGVPMPIVNGSRF